MVSVFLVAIICYKKITNYVDVNLYCVFLSSILRVSFCVKK